MDTIKAKMISCGEIEIDDGQGGYTVDNALLLQCEDKNWRVGGGAHYVLHELEYKSMLSDRDEVWKTLQLIVQEALLEGADAARLAAIAQNALMESALAPGTGNLRVVTVDQLEQIADNIDGFDPPWIAELIGEK